MEITQDQLLAEAGQMALTIRLLEKRLAESAALNAELAAERDKLAGECDELRAALAATELPDAG